MSASSSTLAAIKAQEPWNPASLFAVEVHAKLPRPRRIPPEAPKNGMPGTRIGCLIECRFYVLTGGIAYDGLDISPTESYSTRQEVLSNAPERYEQANRQELQSHHSARD